MKLHIASDLHLDINQDIATIFHRGTIPNSIINCTNKQKTVLILCGDICDPIHWKGLLDILSPQWFHIILVPGNHEFYGYTVAAALDLMQSTAVDFNNVSVLNQQTVILDNIKFCGAVGWAPARQLPGIEKYVEDFRCIQRFNVTRCQELHDQFLEWITLELSTPTKQKKVLITHFGQYSVPVPKRFWGNPFNRYFITGALDLVELELPDFIIFGHTHSSTNRRFGKVPVLCNPRGYGTENPNFNSNLVFSL